MEIVPFEQRHLGAAAELLADQVRTARRVEPSLAARFEDASEARKPLEFVWKLPQSGGVVAIARGRPSGFILGLALPDDPSHYAKVSFAAVSEPGSNAPRPYGEVYREAYAAIATQWVGAGCLAHYVSVPASEPEAIDAWFSLGFGQDNVVGICDTEASSGRPHATNVDIRRAGADDLEPMLDLYDGLGRHLASSPTFIPFRPERWGERQRLAEKLAGGDEPYWLALRESRAIGMLHLAPSARGRPYVPEDCIQLQHAYTVPDARGSGVGTALFDAGLAWAREAGYERCVVDWEPANLQADRFWNRHGFRPISYLLGRRLDPR